MDRSLLTTLLVYTFTLLLIYLLYTILAPFLGALIWAGAIGIITLPHYEKLLKRCNWREIPCGAADCSRRFSSDHPLGRTDLHSFTGRRPCVPISGKHINCRFHS